MSFFLLALIISSTILLFSAASVSFKSSCAENLCPIFPVLRYLSSFIPKRFCSLARSNPFLQFPLNFIDRKQNCPNPSHKDP
ncbi:hypothetical protein ABFX02_08G081100 [Erythranthe guttata]